HYTVLLEPMATDALFVATRPQALRGRFQPESIRNGGFPARGYLLLDAAGSIFNPAHNSTKIRYEGWSNLPVANPAELRALPPAYPDAVTETYLQLPRLDPRVKTLAEQITAKAANPYDRAASIQR